MRFDALLGDTSQVASLILEAATHELKSSFPMKAIPGGGLRDWGEEGHQAIAAGIKQALSGAAGPVHDQIEEELMIAAARGLAGIRLASSEVAASRIPVLCE